ncbi:hypothetical protein DIPPA_10630 [Diplonema papillatum]|nr:hypothetical protein DIPPA_10630 [Diplonema papillatum]|eukprot:gene20245-31145_t
MAHRRSQSPTDRGLFVSQKELQRMKMGHRTPLKTNPDGGYVISSGVTTVRPPHATGAPGTPRGRSFERGGGPQQGRPAWLNEGGDVHISHEEFTAEKLRHATPLRNRSRSLSPRGSPSPRPADLETPWAPIDGTNQSHFQDAYPPTTYYDDGRHPRRSSASPPPPGGLRGREADDSGRVGDPVYEWQGGSHHEHATPRLSAALPSDPPSRAVDQTFTFADDNAHHATDPSNPRMLQHGSREAEGTRRLYYTPNLSGDWVAMPGSEEVLQIEHDQDRHSVVGLAVKDAPWSEIKLGERVEGFVTASTGEVQINLSATGAPVLRLVPFLHESGSLILKPAAHTHGSAGYWEVLPTHLPVNTNPVHREVLYTNHAPPQSRPPHSAYDRPPYDRPPYDRAPYDEYELDTLVNIYT